MEIKDIFITGTDTNVGKTIVSAILTNHLHYEYWKPIQTGYQEDCDSETIIKLTHNIAHKSIYNLQKPISPHLAAEKENIKIDLHNIIRPKTNKSLIIEGAGGILVPINDQHYILDLIKYLNIPTIIVAKNKLGIINHTLLTIAMLKLNSIKILGVIMNGDDNIDNINSIEKYGKINILGAIPYMNNKINQNFIMNNIHISLINNIKKIYG